MPTINQLAAVDSVTGADQVPILSSANGDARKASMTALAEFFTAQVTPPPDTMTQYAAPNATGYSLTVAPAVAGDSVWLLITPTGAFAAGTITLPALAAAVHGQEVQVTSTLAVTTLTVNGNGATVNGAPTTLAANAFFRLRFDGVFNAWYRIG
jgi:hypothetical protein